MAYQLRNRLHLLARHIEEKWFAEFLNFSLGAHERLEAQIGSYVEKVITLEDGADATKQLLGRRAPWRDWLLFRWVMTWTPFTHTLPEKSLILESSK